MRRSWIASSRLYYTLLYVIIDEYDIHHYPCCVDDVHMTQKHCGTQLNCEHTVGSLVHTSIRDIHIYWFVWLTPRCWSQICLSKVNRSWWVITIGTWSDISRWIVHYPHCYLIYLDLSAYRSFYNPSRSIDSFCYINVQPEFGEKCDVRNIPSHYSFSCAVLTQEYCDIWKHDADDF